MSQLPKESDLDRKIIKKDVPKDKELVMGIDPGFKGGIAFLNVRDGSINSLMDIPIEGFNNTEWAVKYRKLEVNANGVADLIRPYADRILVAFVEKVAAAPKAGAASMFRFGQGAGVLHGILAALDIPIIYVHPATWKNGIGLMSPDKNLSRKMAIQKWPKFLKALELQKYEGRAEAALIASYGLMQLSSLRNLNYYQYTASNLKLARIEDSLEITNRKKEKHWIEKQKDLTAERDAARKKDADNLRRTVITEDNIDEAVAELKKRKAEIVRRCTKKNRIANPAYEPIQSISVNGETPCKTNNDQPNQNDGLDIFK